MQAWTIMQLFCTTREHVFAFSKVIKLISNTSETNK